MSAFASVNAQTPRTQSRAGSTILLSAVNLLYSLRQIETMEFWPNQLTTVGHVQGQF